MNKISIEKEKKLIEKAKKDVNAFGDLYDMYIDDIYRFVYFKVGNREDAEDITSQAFEKAIINLSKFEWKGYRIKTWLYTIARNIIIDRYRDKKEINSLDEISFEIEDETIENPEDKATTAIQSQTLLNHISQLPEDQKEIVHLRYIKQLTIKETMQLTGKSMDSVKSLAKRAMKKLRKELKNS